MNIRLKLEKFIDTRPFDNKQLCEMWRKWENSIKQKYIVKETWCNCMSTTDYKNLK